ncbi:MerR family transcriptional regulator [Janibacter limosus]|uniref:MerR family transcriptional regulator n=1 Tax=Janibacter limosus TaxID=53458 RepID=UPI0035D9DE34
MFGDRERDENTRIDRVHIGEVVERTGLSHRTIRYYEEMGLISPSARTDGGFRLYEEADIKRLLLIKPMKPLGFTVEEMGQLLEALDALPGPRRECVRTRNGQGHTHQGPAQDRRPTADHQAIRRVHEHVGRTSGRATTCHRLSDCGGTGLVLLEQLFVRRSLNFGGLPRARPACAIAKPPSCAAGFRLATKPTTIARADP